MLCTLLNCRYVAGRGAASSVVARLGVAAWLSDSPSAPNSAHSAQVRAAVSRAVNER
jgi:hypothetical protein